MILKTRQDSGLGKGQNIISKRTGILSKPEPERESNKSNILKLACRDSKTRIFGAKKGEKQEKRPVFPLQNRSKTLREIQPETFLVKHGRSGVNHESSDCLTPHHVVLNKTQSVLTKIFALFNTAVFLPLSGPPQKGISSYSKGLQESTSQKNCCFQNIMTLLIEK